ncbi:reverse transcriptase domain-containing protein [Trichonephila clavata]|uniref:Reverse transcriptase domain-containing protein n=1 Tax=Trichonephila clavata TaxID=2740835 RepID=A0A8X6G4A8_TRICU|nr:reverse transcriptase domain-containing protein [Trichonephila clavata]
MLFIGRDINSQMRKIWEIDNLASRFKEDNSLYENYTSVFDSQLTDGIIESVNTKNLNQNLIYYMPHHSIIKNDKETTKLRIVFDDSSKEKKTCFSLNDNLKTGPNLNPNPLILLLKFREFRIGLVSDVEKAFLQIVLAEEDRDCQRFLWSDNFPPNNLKIYRNKTVTFGVKSPFLLTATIKHHIKNYEISQPLAYEILNEYLYVDDLITGTNTVNEALELSKHAKLILKDANMNLRKWKTNSIELSQNWEESKFEKQTHNEAVPIKVLGLIWNTLTDEFELDLSSLIDSLKMLKILNEVFCVSHLNYLIL